eukprot:TRINITY_DN447_c0_g1_i1.p1 TRINITY_DN447_c0_g1~~TRINITY_DN447_c0_g1_i1.p1  ORF type:complete len:397 (+),score=126.19 TRINITY_DN447_c0_g1_i1:133-1323(+)
MIRAAIFFAFLISVSGVRLPKVNAFKDDAKSTWIVTFHDTVTSSEIAAHHERFQHDVQYYYNMQDFSGYAAPMNASTMKLVSQSPEVSSIEADQIMHTTESCGRQSGATWGIDRINERKIDIDGLYTYTETAEEILSYIVDTGIYIQNVDFEGRAIWGKNFADTVDEDCNGHGTHVAGTVGGKEYGVAKKTTLIAVKVLACDGSGTNAGVIAGVQYCATDSALKKKRAVANMSLGGGYSAALNKAVAAAVKAGVTFVVAAGNENQDACNTSPASEPLAITVGATTIDDEGLATQVDERASFSNFGKCLDIFAPGQLITAAWIGSPTAIRTISGTSMASPHVAGAAALVLAQNTSRTPHDVKQHLLTQSTDKIIDLACTTNACTLSPNKLLFTTECR